MYGKLPRFHYLPLPPWLFHPYQFLYCLVTEAHWYEQQLPMIVTQHYFSTCFLHSDLLMATATSTASEVTTLWRYRNVCIVIIIITIIFFWPTGTSFPGA